MLLANGSRGDGGWQQPIILTRIGRTPQVWRLDVFFKETPRKKAVDVAERMCACIIILYLIHSYISYIYIYIYVYPTHVFLHIHHIYLGVSIICKLVQAYLEWRDVILELYTCYPQI